MTNYLNYFTHPNQILNIAYALGLLILGFCLAKRASNLTEHLLNKHFSRHHILLIKRSLFYITFTIFAVTGLQHLGFNLSVLLGAAGIFTVAISFASQTAASNLISGIFLLFEHPFKVGDTVEVKGINGVVDSIDLLSTKLKTSDNKLVRIPNEAMIKSEITNLSYFSTRRLDLLIAIAYETDIEKVKNILLELANAATGVLAVPAPSVIINNFANYAVEIKLMVWTKTENFSQLKNSMQEVIKLRFDKEGIESPTSPLSIQRI
ncbi:MAG: mechanosensitive ion channel family protein [Proteobacteria bacterium]|nr:mechanosensitive ion channel family protein [Pseudomonadota bacterium]